MYFQTIIDLYWTQDFLLNISAELIGVTLEVVLVTCIIRKYLDKRDRDKWSAVFSRKLEKTLDIHHEMPDRINKMELVGDVNIAYRIIAWKDLIESYLKEVLALIPQDYNEPMYNAVEKYQESLRKMTYAFIDQKMNIDVLIDINEEAEHMSNYLNKLPPKSYQWDESFIIKMKAELDHLEW